MKCGFVGLGSQGRPMAQRMIEAGLDVTLWARRPETLSPFAASNARTAASMTNLGAACDHIGICVVDDGDVRDVCAKIIPAMAPGGLIAIHSTVHPDTCVSLAREANARGIALIDAPVSGGAPGAAAGTLTVMVGGPVTAFNTAKPVLETFGQLILHLGDVGSGQHAKLINNALMAANMGLAFHAARAADTLGLDRVAFFDLIKASSGRSFAFEAFARQATPQAFAHGAALLAKDVRLLDETLNGGEDAVALRSASDAFLTLALSGRS